MSNIKKRYTVDQVETICMNNPKREFTVDELKIKEYHTTVIQNALGYIKVTDANRDGSFMMLDFFADNPDTEAVEIYDIYTEPDYRRSGIASKFIEYVAAQNTDKVILTASGASMKEYPEKPSDEKKGQIIEDLHEFYTKNNFVDVNKHYGGYEYKRAYMYLNEPGKKILEKLNEREKEEQ